MSSPLICLVIMIKDGKSVIGPTLRTAMPFMDEWFIFDTGSTDGTQTFIQELMKREFPSRPGRIAEEPFVNFEVSRTRALELARQASPECVFQMMLDDSYILHGGEILRAFLEMKRQVEDPEQESGYLLSIGTETQRLLYNSARIFRTSERVAYEGVVHEVPTCTAEEIVPRQCYIEDGASAETTERSRQRYHRDLALLLPEVKAQRGNHLRNVFYLAQTYQCLERWHKAVEWYQKRAEMDLGFSEEMYIAYCRMAQITHKRLNRGWALAQHYYLQAHGVNPRRWECLYKIAKYYYKQEQWNLCHAFAHMAVERSDGPGQYDLFAVPDIYNRRMPNVYCMAAWYCDDSQGRHHQKARELLMQGIRKYPTLEIRQDQIGYFNDRLKDLHVDKHYAYPAKIVREIVQRNRDGTSAKCGGDRVVVTMTTCKRFDLFSRTLNSFLACCTDLDMVHRWVVVDDNSSEHDRQRMQKLYPFIEFILKGEHDRGHARSMNMIRKATGGEDYIFHLEDDWLFLDVKPYITLLLDVLHTEPECGQALVNRNYAERLHDDPLRIVGGVEKSTRHEVAYVVHEHADTDTPEYAARMDTLLPTQASHLYWPHYSLRPGLIRREVWTQLGDYDERDRHFELEYARRYVMAGWKTAFLDGIFSLHIGKLTTESDDTVASAYRLNETERF
uniref:Glycosyltransferase 2-like domain-containing protein n=1 Tax=viral metagenome TaxID=1070528 RepID=A0A6C0BNV5_9ZZZZ